MLTLALAGRVGAAQLVQEARHHLLALRAGHAVRALRTTAGVREAIGRLCRPQVRAARQSRLQARECKHPGPPAGCTTALATISATAAQTNNSQNRQLTSTTAVRLPSNNASNHCTNHRHSAATAHQHHSGQVAQRVLGCVLQVVLVSRNLLHQPLRAHCT